MLDGLDPFSANPADRLLYMVHQRRQVVSALQAKALITAAVNPEKAADAAKAYLEIALPTDPLEAQAKDLLKEETLAALGKLGPISLSNIRVGQRPDQ